MRFLLDTNVFREIGKSNPEANVAAWLNTVDDADLAISALTVREVRKGIVKLQTRKRDVADQIEMRVRGIFDAFGERVLPVTREIGVSFSPKATSTSMTQDWRQPPESTD